MKSFQMLKYSILITLAIIILINVLSGRFFVRLDTTQDGRYTLSNATKAILRELDEPVTIKAYFTRKLPPQLYQARQEFNDLLVEYASRSNGMILYEFIDPSESDALAEEAQSNGIPPLQVQVRNKDKFEAMVCYMGAVIQMAESAPEVIPQINSGMAVEYHLTSAIKKVSIADKPEIAFLQGHGEPGISALMQAQTQLDVLYDSDFIYLNDSTDALAPYKMLAIIAPTDSFLRIISDNWIIFLQRETICLLLLTGWKPNCRMDTEWEWKPDSKNGWLKKVFISTIPSLSTQTADG